MKKRNLGWRALLIGAAWAVPACADPGGVGTVMVTDSSGVAVVTNGPKAEQAADLWGLGREPVVSVGAGLDPEVSLFRVVDVVPLPDGSVGIGTTSPPQVVVANADGTPRVALGGPGQGPGEFSGVSSLMFIPPDSIAVWDAERRRVSVFTEDGRFQRELNLQGVAPLSWIASPNALEASARTYLKTLSQDRWALLSVGVFGPGEGVRRVTAPSYTLSPDGETTTPIGPFPGETTFSSDRTGVAPYPLGADTHFAVSGTKVLVGAADAAEYRSFSDAGALELIVRWSESDTLVAGPRMTAWEAFLDEWLAAMSPSEAGDIREILGAMPSPERLPAYSGLVSSDTGDVWVGEYFPGQLVLSSAYMGRMRVPERDWLVFGAEGSLKAKVRTPTGFRVLSVRDGLVWGVSTDELDVESVVAYELVQGG